jgi:hypothetical protein
MVLDNGPTEGIPFWARPRSETDKGVLPAHWSCVAKSSLNPSARGNWTSKGGSGERNSGP